VLGNNLLGVAIVSGGTMKQTLYSGIAIAALMLLSGRDAVYAESPAAGGRTLGFVVSSLHIAQYESKFWDECPEGLNVSNDEIWFLGLSTEDRGRLTDNGKLNNRGRDELSRKRGPNNEDTCWKPEVFTNDPPLKVIQSKYGYGLDLDGNGTNASFASTCAHDTFEDPATGQKGIDNQLYRVMGCVLGWRRTTARNSDNDADQERRSTGRGLTLLEISGVDNVQDDSDVSVRFFRSVDPPTRDAGGNIIPYGSYRIDVEVDGRPRYGAVARGRIVKGKLITDPLDIDLPYYGGEAFGEINLRAMRLTLDITPDASRFDGLMAGYYDSEKWYWRMRSLQFLGGSNDSSCPAFYQAVQKYADGYRDPKTGKCTALSSAFKVSGVAALVITPKPDPSGQTASLEDLK
jgi:hypothetical protein